MHNYDDKIDAAIAALGTVSTLLSELKFRFREFTPNEKPSETIERLFSFPAEVTEKTFDFRSRGILVDLQQNKAKEKQPGIEQIFSQKEIKEMPKLKDLSYRYRARDGIYEFRYRRNGINKSFCSANYKTAKQKAIDFCRTLNAAESGNFLHKDVAFNEFAENFLETVKKPNMEEKSYYNERNRYNNHIAPFFKNLRVNQVKAPIIQKLLNDKIQEGRLRTAEAMYYILKGILDYAVNNEIINRNPIAAVKIPLHERENGKALMLDDENIFLEKIKGTKYELNFIVLLYTGCRPCELETIAFNKKGFITFRNRKQRKNKIVFKDIPITPMLEPYMERIKAAPLPENGSLAKVFSSIMPGYKMYDLRHTFSTRCQMCGIPQAVVDVWLGHKSNNLTGQVYTHLPDQYMLELAKKVVY